VIIFTELPVNGEQFLIVRSEHDSQGDAHHLQICTSCGASNGLRSSLDVVLNLSLNERDFPVVAFTVDFLLYTSNLVEFESSLTGSNVENSLSEHNSGATNSHSC